MNPPKLIVDNDASEGAARANLKAGDGGGTFDGMEARVAKLEADTAHIRQDVTLMQGDLRLLTEATGGKGGLRERLTALEVEVKNLPTKDWISGRIMWAVVIIGLLLGLQLAVQRAITPTLIASPSQTAPIR